MKRILAAIIVIASLVVLGGTPAHSRAGTPMDVTLVTKDADTNASSFADPGLLITPVGSGFLRYYLYRTNAAWATDATYGQHLRVIYVRGAKMNAFGELRAAKLVPQDAANWWVATTRTDFWAPHVFHNGTQYVLWFSARAKAHGRRCIGAAYSASPEGPFTAMTNPLMCPNSVPNFAKVPQNIDPAMYRAPDGKRYLVAKRYCCDSGKNADGEYLHDSEIYARQVTANGLGLQPNTANIVLKRFDNAPTIEAPSIVTAVGKLWLFVSRNDYRKCSYKTQVFSATSITSPFRVSLVTMPANTASGADLCGDGGLEAAWDPSTNIMRTAFHAFPSSSNGWGSGGRQTYTGCLGWGTGVPRLVNCPE